jgi:hypothetical protein
VAGSLPINSLLSVVTIEIVKIKTKHQIETLEHILNREIKWKGCASEHNNREEGNRRGRTYQKSGVLQSSSPDGKDMEDKIVKLLIRKFLKITFVIRICIFDDKREEIRKNV